MLRQLTAIGAVVTALAAMTGVAGAGPVTVSSTVNAGTVTITQTTDPVTGVADFAVSIKGVIRDHDWTYTGELSGTRQSDDDSENLNYIDTFDVTATPAGVTGMCNSYSTSGSLANVSAPVDADLECLLSKDGSAPWLASLNSTLAPVVTDTNLTTWQGYYTQTQTTRPTLRQSPTHGDSQVHSNGWGDGDRYSLQLSGQIAIGSALFNGELASDWSQRFYLHDGPPEPIVNVSGSNDGHTVAGPCSGYPTSSGWAFECSLSLDSAPAVDVQFVIKDANSGTFCTGSYADGTYICDSYTTGTYSDGKRLRDIAQG